MTRYFNNIVKDAHFEVFCTRLTLTVLQNVVYINQAIIFTIDYYQYYNYKIFESNYLFMEAVDLYFNLSQ